MKKKRIAQRWFWTSESSEKDHTKYCHKQIDTAFYAGVKGYVIVGVNVYVDVDMDADAEVQLGELVPALCALIPGVLGNILSKYYWMGKVVLDYQWPTFTTTCLS